MMAINRLIGTDLVIGAGMGVLGAIFNQSATGNLISTGGASLLTSALAVWPMKTQEKFFSRETALTALTIAGGSVVSHLITDAIIHRHHPKPTIIFAPQKECAPCADKSWVQRMQSTPETSPSRGV
jgi:hypothetical protein